MNKKTFSIETKINPITNQPFGSKYSGNFTIRQASMMDRQLVASRVAAEINMFGLVDESQMPPGLVKGSRICHTVGQLSTEPAPDWFDRSKMFDENDEAALLAVEKEVVDFSNSFRAGVGSGDGGKGGEDS